MSALINWKSKEVYIQDRVKEGKALDMRETFRDIKIESKEKALINIQEKLAEALLEFEEVKSDIRRLAQLTILLLNSQRNLQMAKQTPEQKDQARTYGRILKGDGTPAIMFDDVINNYDRVNTDYDITIDQTTGEVWIGSNSAEAGSLIQGVIKGYLKPNQEPLPPGAEFNYVIKGKVSPPSKIGTRAALFSGSIYFEDLPVDVFATEPKVQVTDLKVEDTTSAGKVIKDEKQQESDRSQQTNSDIQHTENGSAEDNTKQAVSPSTRFIFPSESELRTIAKGKLKPQSGLSRTERKEWNAILRKKYPNCFDAGGNWIGFNVSSDTTAPVAPPAIPNVEEKTPNKTTNALGLLGETGVGNSITRMTDAKVRNGYMLARLFPGKGYALVSTPAKDGDGEKSAFIICNKERTARFLLAGLEKSPSFSTRVDGCEVLRASILKPKYFEDDRLYVYWITNAVTALMALGMQSKETEDVH